MGATTTVLLYYDFWGFQRYYEAVPPGALRLAQQAPVSSPARASRPPDPERG